MSDDVLTPEQAAELLHLPVAAVRQLASRGLIPCKRYGRLYRFSKEKLIAQVQAGDPCPSTDAKAPRTSGVDSSSVVAAFNNLAEPPIARRRKSTKPSLGLVSGGKPS
jgi:excisionase family DNA binding protein